MRSSQRAGGHELDNHNQCITPNHCHSSAGVLARKWHISLSILWSPHNLALSKVKPLSDSGEASALAGQIDLRDVKTKVLVSDVCTGRVLFDMFAVPHQLCLRNQKTELARERICSERLGPLKLIAFDRGKPREGSTSVPLGAPFPKGPTRRHR